MTTPDSAGGNIKKTPCGSKGLTGTENPGKARVCFLIDPQINLGAKRYGGDKRRRGFLNAEY